MSQSSDEEDLAKKFMLDNIGSTDSQDEDDYTEHPDNTIDQILKEKKLIIITGSNGSGKTHLLNKYTAEFERAKKIIYIPSHEVFKSQFTTDDIASTHHSFDEPVKQVTRLLRLLRNKGIVPKLNIIEDKVCKILNKDSNFQSLDKEEQEAKIRTELFNAGIIGKMISLDNPINSLLMIINLHFEHAKNIVKRLSIKDAEIIYNFYNDTYQPGTANPQLDFRSFFSKIALPKEKGFREKVTNAYVCNAAKLDQFQKDLNTSLNAIHYKYNIQIDFNESNEPIVNFKNLSTDKIISASEIKLSSGEIWILGLIMLQFAFEYYSDSISSKQQKVILLDEFDKHLDPKSCKTFLKIITDVFVSNGIKVIITTHRPDTVTLAPEGSIFVIENNDQDTKIVECHKLQAMFRMTSNIRELVNYHHKVYTESLNDAYFYEGVYSSLRAYCLEVRDKARQDSKHTSSKADYYWYIKEEPFRILSERSKLAFHSTSKQRDDAGGSNEVISFVTSDMNNIVEALKIKKSFAPDASKAKTIEQIHFEARWLLGEPDICASYGILDYDNGNTRTKLSGAVAKLNKANHELGDKINQNIKILSARYSIENFIFDPFIFCSVLTNEEIKAWIEKSNITNKETMHGICIEIKCDIINKHIFMSAQNLVNKYFDLMKNTMDTIFQQRYTNPNDAQAIKINTALQNSTNTNITLIMGVNNDKQILIQYPNYFLTMPGHTIEALLFNQSLGKELTSELSQKIYHCGLQAIPLDLAQVLFDLNASVIQNVRDVTKKGEMPTPQKTFAQEESSTGPASSPVAGAAAAAAEASAVDPRLDTGYRAPGQDLDDDGILLPPNLGQPDAPPVNSTEDTTSQASPTNSFTEFGNSSDDMSCTGSTPDSDTSLG